MILSHGLFLLEKTQGERQQKGVKKSCGGPENGDVLHKSSVPQKSDDQNINQENDEKHDKSLNAFACCSARSEILKHLICTNKIKMYILLPVVILGPRLFLTVVTSMCRCVFMIGKFASKQLIANSNGEARKTASVIR